MRTCTPNAIARTSKPGPKLAEDPGTITAVPIRSGTAVDQSRSGLRHESLENRPRRARVDRRGGTLETLLEADQIEKPATLPSCELIVACDVDNPLLGPRGATRVYGPQKGVRDFTWFEQRLAHLADLARRDLGVDPREIPGAGAAGGLGFGLMAFLGGRLVSGFDMVATQVGLEARVASADLVVTGEGRLDEQSLQGKGPVGVARLARRLGKKIVGVAGSVDDSAGLRAQFDLLIGIKPAAMPLDEAMRRTGELIESAVSAHAAPLRALNP